MTEKDIILGKIKQIKYSMLSHIDKIFINEIDGLTEFTKGTFQSTYYSNVKGDIIFEKDDKLKMVYCNRKLWRLINNRMVDDGVDNRSGQLTQTFLNRMVKLYLNWENYKVIPID